MHLIVELIFLNKLSMFNYCYGWHYLSIYCRWHNILFVGQSILTYNTYDPFRARLNKLILFPGAEQDMREIVTSLQTDTHNGHFQTLVSRMHPDTDLLKGDFQSSVYPSL